MGPPVRRIRGESQRADKTSRACLDTTLPDTAENVPHPVSNSMAGPNPCLIPFGYPSDTLRMPFGRRSERFLIFLLPVD